MKKQLFIVLSFAVLTGTMQQAWGMEEEKKELNQITNKMQSTLQPSKFCSTLKPSTLKPASLKPASLKPASLKPTSLKPTNLQPKLDETWNNDIQKIKNKLALLKQQTTDNINKANTDYYNNMPSEHTLDYLQKGIEADKALMKNYYSNVDAISSELDEMVQQLTNEFKNNK